MQRASGEATARPSSCYDEKSLRAEKFASGTTTVYIFSGTRVIAEYQNGVAPSSPTREYIYSGGGLLAKIESGAVQYYHPDQLSVRMMTHSTRPPRRTRSGQADSSGKVIGQQEHHPFGESWYQTNTTTKWFFTAGVYPERSRRERDAESGNDYASFRYDANRLGRFASPDLLAGSPADPQTLNRYPYVRGDPVNLVDPLGLDSCDSSDQNYGGGCEPGDESNGVGDPYYNPGLCTAGFECGDGLAFTGLDGGYLVDGFIPVSGGLAQGLLQSGSGTVCEGFCGTEATTVTVCDSGVCTSQTVTTTAGQRVYLPSSQVSGQDDLGDSLTGPWVPASWITLGQLLADPFGTGAGGVQPTLPGRNVTTSSGANRLGALLLGTHALVTSYAAFLGAGVHVFAAGALVVGGCGDPTPFEPLTCGVSVFGAASAGAGAGVLAAFGASQITNEVIPNFEQVMTGKPAVPGP